MSFSDLSLNEDLVETVTHYGWKEPTPIQKECIPVILSGRDVVGLAKAGSGKTGAYLLPILDSILKKPRLNFALILCPTRELVIQTIDVCQKLGEKFGLKTMSLIGGQSADAQTSKLKKEKFHIFVGTPGRVGYHLAKSKALHLDKLRFLVVDEADHMLGENFEAELSIITESINEKRRTILFSATMCDQLKKLEKLCKNPKMIEVANKYDKSEKLEHAFVFLPEEAKECYALHLIKNSGVSAGKNRCIFYANTWRDAYRLCRIFNKFFSNEENSDKSFAVLIHGHMKQTERQESISDFRSGVSSVLVATDVVSRGIDVPDVDLVINYDVPVKPSWSDCVKSYVHRIGRTARASRIGRAVMLVSPYAVSHLKIIEETMGEKIPQIKWVPPEDSENITWRLQHINEELKADLKDESEQKMNALKRRAKTKHKGKHTNREVPLKKIKVK
ncbi:putative ATP-dependent RNA helicase ddx49 [Cichlidogyrus casuarinus]|uniref:RNA helicase n=1 Tax=Cichlidogyrus casuarinus TaxID=1844966 RepID=A0ABD2QHU2_9PLAT